MGVAVYEDQFVFYADDLEFVMYDMLNDQVLWTISR